MKRNLGTILNDTAVGITMTLGGIEIFETMYKLGQQIGPEIQEYVGRIGSGAVEFGLPGLYAVAAVPLIYKTVKAIDRLQLENQTD